VIVSEALVQMRLMHARQTREQLKSLKIGSVYYVAPDEDLDTFRNIFLDNVEDLWDSAYVYTSESDGAIGMSRALYSKYPRLGRSLKELTPEDKQSLAKSSRSGFIECSYAQERAGKGKSGHGYWYGNPWISGDIALSLMTHRPPAERGLVRGEDGAIWKFPETYPERVAKIAAEVAQAESGR
jgi:esterase/lipase superfamily enzyme